MVNRETLQKWTNFFKYILFHSCTPDYLYTVQQNCIDTGYTFDDFCWRCYRNVKKSDIWKANYSDICAELKTDKELLQMMHIALKDYEW